MNDISSGRGRLRRTAGALALVVFVAGVAWQGADATGRRTPPGGCRVSPDASGPEQNRGFAPGAEGTPPADWTEADTRPFDWNGDGAADRLEIDDANGTAVLRWSGGSLTVAGIDIPTSGSPAGPGRSAAAAPDAEPQPRPAASADVTGDGWPDLIVASRGVVRVLVGPGSAADQTTSIDVADIGESVPGWVSAPITAPDPTEGRRQIPYDNAVVRPLWDLDADGADDFAVISGTRRTSGPTARYRGRPCESLAAGDRLSHRPGRPNPDPITGDGRAGPATTTGGSEASVGGRPATTSGPGTTMATGTVVPTTVPPPGPPTTGRPSVLTVDTPDPSILRQGTTYHLFTTNIVRFTGGYMNIPVRRSTTLWAWDNETEALPSVGSWSSGNHTGLVWAPTAHQFDSTYVLYYVAPVRAGLGGAGRQCIGRATASTPDGPYVDSAAAPIACQSLLGGSIDPHVFVDPGGVPWLTFKNDGNCCGLPSGLWSMQLTADGQNLTGPAYPLLSRDQAWESPTIENPAMVRANDVTWLFYSGNDWTTQHYATGYGWCWQAAGPCEKTTTSEPWLKTTTYANGPGGADLFTDPAGGWWVVYHGWTTKVGYPNGGVRQLYVDKVDFGPRGPVIDSSVPYQTILPRPPKVAGVTARQIGHNAARVRWDRVDVEPPVDYYSMSPPVDYYSMSAVDVDGQTGLSGCGWGASGTVTETDIPCLRDGHTYDITVTAQTEGGPGPPSDPARVTLGETGARFVGLTPTRVLDTRDGTGTGGDTSHVGAGETVTLSLAGRGGLPAAGQFSGVVVNLTVTDPSGPSHLRVYPGDTDSPPESSSINFDKDTTIASMVTVAAADDGTIKIFNNSGQAHVIADVVGYYGAPTDATGALHRSLTPARVLDTRDGQGLPGQVAAKVGAQQSISLPLAGRGGLPAAGEFSSVIINITAVGGSQISHTRVYPGDQTSPPFASSLNFDAGQTIANLVTVRAAADGTVKLYNQSGEVDLVADVVGYYGPLGGGQGAVFYAVPPSRVEDTRWWPADSGRNPLPAGQPLLLTMQHPNLAYLEPMSSAVLTLTVDQPSAPSHLTAWPSALDMPTASNLNFVPHQVIANQASVKVSPPTEGSWAHLVNVQNNAGTVQVIADLNGWFGPEA